MRHREKNKSLFVRKTISCCLIGILLLSSFFVTGNLGQLTVYASDASKTQIYTTATWAKPEIEKAYENGLIPQRLLSTDATKPATREELCELAVLLYEKLSSSKAEPIAKNPFTDTTNIEILKALNLGITSGTSTTTFSPNDITNREQVATMFGRTISKAFPTGDYSTVGAPTFSDQSDISSYALAYVLYMSKKGIIKGASGKFMPRAITEAHKLVGYGTTKREDAIAIANRIFEAYGNIVVSPKEKYAISLLSTAKPNFTEQEKYNQIDFSNRVFRPVYKSELQLMAANGFTSNGSQTYSSSAFTTMVRSDKTSTESFKFTLPANVLTRTSQIVWQVSLVPFDGRAVKSNASQPGGLLLSGTLPKSSTTFEVDFNKVKLADDALRNPHKVNTQFIRLPRIPIIVDLKNTWSFSELLNSTSAPIKTAPKTYYVRAYPVDSQGNSIGDAGNGLTITYGDPLQSRNGKSLNVSLLFSLKPARTSGTVGYDGEFPNNFIDLSEASMLHTSSKLYSVLPSGFPDKTQELKVQVSLVDYAKKDWQTTEGIVYEKSYFPNDKVFSDLKTVKPLGIPIDFTSIVPPDTELSDTEKIPYYVRVIALTEGMQPNTVNATYSKTVLIKYGKPSPSNIKLFEQVKVEPRIPKITKLTYTPVKWEAYDWQYHYVITRQPTYKEVFGVFIGDDKPFTAFPVGATLDFTPKEENKSWWEEALDAISEFFTDVVGFLTDVANWVSKAYADLKTGIIKFAASALPLGDPLNGYLEDALTALVDYGLASMGIPPTLPNFDELSEMGVDYLATVAMEQAGIPASDLAKDGVGELASGLKDSMKSSANAAASPNPMNWNFIQFDPVYLYRPAYVMVELYNPYNETTPSGSLSITVDKLMDLTKNGTDSVITSLYARYGSSWVTLYKPVFGMKIPSLAPYQRISIPVFLEEVTGSSFYGNGATVDRNDFRLMYWGLGTFDFSVSTTYDLPSVIDAAKSQGIYKEDVIYSYSSYGSGMFFSHDPTTSYAQ